jgi:hypothetical protein
MGLRAIPAIMVCRVVLRDRATAFELPGLELARLADLPKDALAEAKRVAGKLAAMQAKDEEESESSKIALRRKALLRVTFFFLFISFLRQDLRVLATDLSSGIGSCEHNLRKPWNILHYPIKSSESIFADSRLTSLRHSCRSTDNILLEFHVRFLSSYLSVLNRMAYCRMIQT